MPMPGSSAGDTGTRPPRQWFRPEDVPLDVRQRISTQWSIAADRLERVSEGVPQYVAKLHEDLQLMATGRDLAEVPLPATEMLQKNIAIITRTGCVMMTMQPNMPKHK